MAAPSLPFLDLRVPIVDGQGRPTSEFSRWFQDNVSDVINSLKTAQTAKTTADAAVPATRHVDTGTGLSGGGDLTANRTLTLHAHINDLLDVDTSTPPTTGQALIWNGSTDWVPGTVAGGGGGLALIGSVVVTGASAAAITFAAIPGTYKDLIVSYLARSTTGSSNADIHIQLNGDTGANYDSDRVNRFGSVQFVGATSAEVQTIAGSTAPANVGDAGEFTIPNYATTIFQKSGHCRGAVKTANSGGSLIAQYSSFWWRNTAAITQIDLIMSSGNFDIGSVFHLYGRS